MSGRLSIRVKAFLLSIWSRLYEFREANHSEIVKAMAKLPKYPAPRVRYAEPVDAKVRIARDWRLRLVEWGREYAPNHKRSA
jgi:hypothetical protein